MIIKHRRGTAAEWSSANPVLNDGELGFELDTNRHKIGNGVDLWSALPYHLNEDDVADLIANAVQDQLSENDVADLIANAVYTGSSQTPLFNRSGLLNWYVALAGHETAEAGIWCAGDSNTEGAGATNVDRSWPALLQERLRSRMGTTGGKGLVPAAVTDLVSVSGMTYTGTPNKEFSGPGFGKRALNVTNTDFVTFAAKCTAVRVYHAKGDFVASTGTVAIDGTPVVTNLPGIAGSKSDGYFWDSGPLSPGTHIVKVSATTAGGYAFTLDGVVFYDGDSPTDGIRVYNAGHSGSTHADFLTSFADTGYWQLMAAVKPKLVIVSLGINDLNLGASVAQTLADLDTYLTKVADAMGAEPYSVLLLAQYFTPILSSDDWAAYVEGLRSRAVGNVSFINAQNTWPALLADGSTNSGLMWETTDPIHPSNVGHSLLADIALGVVAGPG